LIDFNELTDQECLELVTELMDTRLTVQSVYTRDDNTGYLTHEILVFRCGDMEAISSPALLEHPLMPAPIITGVIH
jgi:hypothetical protein